MELEITKIIFFEIHKPVLHLKARANVLVNDTFWINNVMIWDSVERGMTIQMPSIYVKGKIRSTIIIKHLEERKNFSKKVITLFIEWFTKKNEGKTAELPNFIVTG